MGYYRSLCGLRLQRGLGLCQLLLESYRYIKFWLLLVMTLRILPVLAVAPGANADSTVVGMAAA